MSAKFARRTIASLGLMIAAATAAAGAPRKAPTLTDVRYGALPGQTLDFWRADGKGKPTALLVLFHGGQFMGGDKKSFRASPLLGPALAAGVSVAAVNYRHLPVAPVQESFLDAARAVQFLRWKAKEWNVDGDHVGALGINSGGTMALWLAFGDDRAAAQADDPVLRASTRLQAAAAVTPQFTYDVLQWSEALGVPHDKFFPEIGRLYGFGPEVDLRSEKAREIRSAVDVRAFISPDDPPVYLYAPQPGGRPDDRQRYLNHPVHARLIKQRCDGNAVQAVLYTPGDGGPAPPGGNDTAMMQFLLREIGRR